MTETKKNPKRVLKFDTPQDVVHFLDELKHYFEDGARHGQLDLLPPVDEFYRLEMSIKIKEGKYQIKFKSKELEQTVKEQKARRVKSADVNKPEYKDLKKRMKAGFREIKTALLEKRCPDEATTEAFLSDSTLMTSYEGYGDEYYDEYRRACHEFELAYKQKNIEKMGLIFMKLDNLRQDCHDRYI